MRRALAIARWVPFLTAVVFPCACRSRGARPDDVVRPIDAAPSSNVVAGASASVIPPPDAWSTTVNGPRAWFGGPRDRSLLTETVSLPIHGEVEYFHIASSEGVLARIVNARIDTMVVRGRPSDYFGPVPSGYARSNVLHCDGFATARLLSWRCSDMSELIDLALSAKGMGGAPAGALMSFYTVTFRDAEQTVGDNLARADLFREDATDVLEKGCGQEIERLFPGGSPTGEINFCVATEDFLLSDDGLVLAWFDVLSDGYKYQNFLRLGTIRWRAFGKKLRSDGAACSFEWSAPTDADGPVPITQDEACK